VSKEYLQTMAEIRQAEGARDLLAVRAGLDCLPDARERRRAQHAINKRLQSFVVTQPRRRS